jgi:hypothetical protein
MHFQILMLSVNNAQKVSHAQARTNHQLYAQQVITQMLEQLLVQFARLAMNVPRHMAL